MRQMRPAVRSSRAGRADAWLKGAGGHYVALLQSRNADTRGLAVGYVSSLGCLQLHPLADELDCFCYGRRTETEGALDNAGFAADIASEIEGRCLSFAKCAHHLKALDRRVSCFQCLKSSDRSDQLLKLSMISLNDVVQILDLSMHRLFRTLALLLEFGQSGGVGWRLVGVDDRRLLPIFKAFLGYHAPPSGGPPRGAIG
jgi:hypothetical protein